MLHLGLSSQPNSMYGPTCALGCSCQSFAFRRRRAKRGRRLLRTSHLTGSRADAIIVLEGHWRISPALLACTVRSGVPSSSRFLMNSYSCQPAPSARIPFDVPGATKRQFRQIFQDTLRVPWAVRVTMAEIAAPFSPSIAISRPWQPVAREALQQTRIPASMHSCSIQDNVSGNARSATMESGLQILMSAGAMAPQAAFEQTHPSVSCPQPAEAPDECGLGKLPES